MNKYTDTHVFACPRAFARPVFGKCLRPPMCLRDDTCLRDDACLRQTCLREVSSHAHVSSRRHVSSPGLSSGSVFARSRVFATTRVFARPVFGKCLRDDACLRQTCLREVSSPAHVSSRRHVSSPDLSSGSVFATARFFATTRVFAGPVFGKCLRPPTCLHDDACLCLTCLRDVSSHAHVTSRRRVPSPDLSSGSVFSDTHGFTSGQALARTARSGGVFAKTRVFATTRRPTRVFAGNVSSDAHVSSLSSPGMCLLTPTCLRRPCVRSPALHPMCLQSVSSVFGQYVHPPGDRNAIRVVACGGAHIAQQLKTHFEDTCWEAWLRDATF